MEQAFKLSGDFNFNSYNIKSMEGFSFHFSVSFPELTQDQQGYIQDTFEAASGLRAWRSAPWGDNPRFNEVTFETREGDFEGCKTMITLLQEGKDIPLTANGYRYGSGHHPLMAQVQESTSLRQKFGSLTALNDFISQTLKEAQVKYPAPQQP